jgi:hypothetical protein
MDHPVQDSDQDRIIIIIIGCWTRMRRLSEIIRFGALERLFSHSSFVLYKPVLDRTKGLLITNINMKGMFLGTRLFQTIRNDTSIGIGVK